MAPSSWEGASRVRGTRHFAGPRTVEWWAWVTCSAVVSIAKHGVLADGSVVVGTSYSTSGTEAFRWTSDGGMVGLGDLPGGGFHSSAYGVSADGSVIVGQGYSASGHEVFIWDQVNGIQSLKDSMISDYGLVMTGWTLTYAEGISSDGLSIVGFGTNPTGHTEAWRVTVEGGVVPAPGAFLLGSLGLSLAGWKLRRREELWKHIPPSPCCC